MAKRKPKAQCWPGTPEDIPAGIKPLHISCPACGFPHYDVGEWRTKPHETHSCLHCGCKFKVDADGIKTVGILPDETCAYGMVLKTLPVELNDKNLAEIDLLLSTGLWGPRREDALRHIIWKFLRDEAGYLAMLADAKLKTKRRKR